MPRGCEQDMYTDLLWQNIYVDWLAIFFYPDTYIAELVANSQKIEFLFGFPAFNTRPVNFPNSKKTYFGPVHTCQRHCASYCYGFLRRINQFQVCM